jgi:gamma-glutamylcyclotransferase (GGCT)/AIG2-like uncharacterized protein YtfP
MPAGEAERRLAAYGTLAPGEANHDVIAGLRGSWTRGHVHGDLHDRGWGATEGFPGLRSRPEGPRVAVWVLTSADLPEHWARLDAFEGPAYRRVVVPVHLDGGGLVLASLYEVEP